MDLIQDNNNFTIKLKNKTNTFNWRKNNPEKYIELSRKHSLEYYYRNREEILEKQKIRYRELKNRLF
jgi:hypothetical protein